MSSMASASVGFSPIRWKGARKMPNFIPLWAMASDRNTLDGRARGSAGRLARVDGENLAGDVAGERAAEERGRGGDVVRRRHPLERRALEQRLAHGLDGD